MLNLFLLWKGLQRRNSHWWVKCEINSQAWGDSLFPKNYLTKVFNNEFIAVLRLKN